MQIDLHDADWHGLPPLLAGLRARGLLPLQFAHFGNWYEQVGGLTWDCYLQQRSGALRETIRRKLRGAERNPRLAVQILPAPTRSRRALRPTRMFAARSWKAPEPFPALMRC